MEEKSLVILGYSGHSFGCIEVARQSGFVILGYCEPSEKAENPYDLSYLGYEDDVDVNQAAFIAVGDNKIRRRIYRKLSLKNNFLKTSLIHSSAIVSTSSLIQEQTYLSAGVIINPKAKIGTACIINTGATIEHDCVVDQFSHVAPGAVLCGNVSVGTGCMIGANAVIKEGVKIGDYVTVGAGSVVLKDIDSNTVVVGNPSKKLLGL